MKDSLGSCRASCCREERIMHFSLNIASSLAFSSTQPEYLNSQACVYKAIDWESTIHNYHGHSIPQVEIDLVASLTFLLTYFADNQNLILSNFMLVKFLILLQTQGQCPYMPLPVLSSTIAP